MEKLAQAKESLGDRYVLHPHYSHPPAHQVRDSYYLRQVAERAKQEGRL